MATVAPQEAVPGVPPQRGWALFAVVSASLAAGLAGSTLQTPLYPLYSAAWHLTALQITELYVSYMAGVICSLLFLGRLSDQFGRPSILRVALGLLTVALVASIFAPGLSTLMAARAMIGVGSGMLTSTCAAALVELHPRNNLAAASLASSAATIIGLGSGPLFSGMIAQWLPWPFVLPYAISALVITGLTLALLVLAPGRLHGGRVSLRPRFRLPDAPCRMPFLAVGFVGFCGFAVIGLLNSLAPSVLRTIISCQGPAIGGAAVTLLFAVSGLTQILARGVNPERALWVGCLAMAAGLGLLAAATAMRWGSIFLSSEVVVGAGQGLSFMAALAIANRLVEPQHRAASLSAFLVIVYLGAMLPVIVVGALASRFGLPLSVTMFSLVAGCVCVAAIPLCVAALSALAAQPRRSGSVEAFAKLDTPLGARGAD